MTFRLYSRVTVVFLLFTAYPVVTKLADGRLAHDWLHSALHFVSALVAIYTGWSMPTEWLARLYTWGIGTVYLVLGAVGWFIDGLFLNTHLAIPLGPVDNVFHLALGVFAFAVISADAMRARNDAPHPAA